MEPESLDLDARRPAGERLGRLTKRAEFQRVSRGRRWAAQAFSLQAARRQDPNGAPAGARIGLTVTKKVGNAVVRNRIRRRLREALVVARPLEAREDHDYVLVARRQALSRDFSALVGDLRDAFHATARADEDKGRPPSAAKDKDRRT
ncbi:MAG: ribonuclease P protein component [Hyphomicrobiales bacterium]|nr:ribonuclease P protein component [Hyphomicrobiales bacterium]